MKKASFARVWAVLLLVSTPQSILKKKVEIPFVPTPPRVVKEMLHMAAVGPDDILYDLGSGDGRIIIAAARETGCRGVGIEIDQQLIEASLKKAAQERVAERVRFIRKDLFKADIREATVVTLYLFYTVNLRLRPKLLRELAPGTRVVSHDFGMGDWRPDRRTSVRVEEDSHTVYLWVVPANVSGTWRWALPSGRKRESWHLEVNQSYQKLRGTLFRGKEEIPIRELSIEGDLLRLSLEYRQGWKKVRMEFSGMVSGHTVTGSMQPGSGQEKSPTPWHAVRDPRTIRSIEGDLSDWKAIPVIKKNARIPLP